ncbi:MAG: hypothetical protein U0324_18785 [Polyangiales bacterium]
MARSPSGDWYADCAREGRYLIDLRRQRANCGACGRACAGEGVCADGVCAPCRVGLSRCGDVCVDLGDDPAHCGACDRACAGGASCEAGVCVGCRAGSVRCGAACVDVLNDPAHCGACGRACPAGRACAGGACAPCASGLTACSGACVDLSSHAAHCGACGVACVVGAECRAGACGDCPPGRAVCGGACVDLRSDAAHCGACGRRCEHACVDGACAACPAGASPCAGGCYVEFASPEHCGACGHACAATERCVAGACVPCPADTARCGLPYCDDLRSSSANCGACGVACPEGQVCSRGRCGPPCNERTAVSHNDAHCGACGASCAFGAICIDSRCVAFSPRPKAPISATQVTSVRPWFRWEVPSGADGARVEVCADRGCARVEARWDAAGDSLRAPTALAPGVHFWRLYTRRGVGRFDAAPGLTWEFVVPAAIALPPLDAVGRDGAVCVSDFNGDGWSDAVDPTCAGTDGCVSVRFGPSGGTPALPERRIPTPSAAVSDVWTTTYGIRAGDGYGDLNGDGYADLLFTLRWTTYRGVAWFNNGDIVQLFAGGPSGLATRFQVLFSHAEYTYLSGALTAAPIGDRNGDGYGDVAIWHEGLTMGSMTGEVHLIRLGGRTTEGGQEATDERFIPNPRGLLTGDFNADGYGDFVADVSRTLRAEVWMSRGSARPSIRDGAWVSGCGAPVDAPEVRFRGVVVDDDLDGYDDLHAEWSHGAVIQRVLLRGGPDGLSSTRCTRLP